MNALSWLSLKHTELEELAAGKQENETTAVDTELYSCEKD